MFRGVIIVTIIVFGASSFVSADFPVEEVWSVEFDTTVTCLGPNWQEDGQTFFLVGLENKAVIVSEGEIIWESESLAGEVIALNRVDFGVGDGAELLVVAMNDSLSMIYRLQGEEYGEQNEFRYGDINDFNNPYYFRRSGIGFYDSRSIRHIDVIPRMLPDTTKTVVVINSWFQRVYDGASMGGSTVKLISNDGEDIQELHESSIPLRQIQASPINDESVEFIGGFRDVRDIWLRGHRIRYDISCGIVIYNDEFEEMGSLLLSELAIDDAPFNETILYDFEIVSSDNGDKQLFAFYTDSLGAPFISKIDYDEFEVIRSLRTGRENYRLGLGLAYIRWQHDEEDIMQLLIISEHNRVDVVDAQELTYLDSWEYDHPYLDATTGNFDDDEDFELAWLSPTEFYMYDVEPTATPSHPQPNLPTAYSIRSAYPNPFNSKIKVAYTLPRANHYSLIVYDVNGAEITRLADEWQSAGSYRTVWEATGVPSGTYFIKLGVDGQGDTQAIQLIK
ncbi:MAG: T9SS type A sorting domain-containing protein [Candidatus Electryoneaceae bacterium]|nr:T9SS type A sorting domain-containing protein [Candidatus Electryoneaceae bacterium]